MSKIAAVLAIGLVAVSVGVLATMGVHNVPADNALIKGCFRPSGAGPGFDASIGNQQNNKTICIPTGERLLVLLSAGNPNATPWSPPRVSRTGLLGVAPLTMMLSRGLTGRNFKALRVGIVRLSSQRPVCTTAPGKGATCDAIELWQVTVVIAKPERVPPLSVVYGKVVQGPTCPVERLGHPCLPAPVIGKIEVQNTEGQNVASTSTNTNGAYSFGVHAGTYTLVVVTGKVFPRCPHDMVIVAPNSRLYADITCDTGLR